MNTEERVANSESPLLMYLILNNIPFKVTQEGVIVAETTKCTDEQVNRMLEIEKTSSLKIKS